MKPETGFRTATDGTRLFHRQWGVPEPRAAVVMVHGIAEHGSRYHHVGTHLAGAGFDVRISDLRGFGESGGRRAFVDSFETYLDDLVADVEAAASLGVPVVLLGHSLGGLIAFLYAVSERPQPDLLVLSTPAIDAKIGAPKRAAARIFGKLMPGLAINNGLDGSQLSTDPAVGEAYFADPLLVPKTTAKLGVELLNAMSDAQTRLQELSMPTLVIHGAADTIVPPTVSAPFVHVPVAERRLFPGFRHETFNENGGRESLAAVTDWIGSQLAE